MVAPSVTGASPVPWSGAPGYGYLERPTDQLGVPGSEAGAGLTPEGAVFTPSVEVVPWLKGRAPGIAARRGLPEPKAPLMATGLDRRGASAAWWAAPIAGVPAAVIALAPARRREAGVALRWGGTAEAGARPPAYRFVRPAVPARSGLYSQPGEPFAPGRCWTVKRTGGALVISRGASVVAVVVGAGRRTRAALPGVRPRRCATSPRQFAVGLRLRSRARDALMHVIVPLVPLARTDPRLPALLASDVRASGTALVGAWIAQRATGATIQLPEAAVQRALDASIVTMLVPRYQLPDGTWVQTVNTLQYHAFWLRDAAAIGNALDLVGLHGVAAENLAFTATWQSPEGEFSSRVGQRDGHGQALWALGQHVVTTGDAAFARAWVPAVTRAVAWTEQAMATNPLGLLPPSDPRDNELVAGQVTGDQFWAVAGLDAAASLAGAAGDRALRGKALALRDTLRDRVVALARSTAVGGRIRPVLDQVGGYSWGELWAAWPYPSMAPTDPLVQSTMAASIAEQREGVGTYAGGAFLHLYTGFRVWQTLLRAGDQVQPLEGLYATLAHLTSTGGGFETNLRPLGRRDARSNLAPHAWLSAEIVTLVHDLLARPQDGGLVVMGAVPGPWLAPGANTVVRALPTPYGPIDLTLEPTPTGAALTWALAPRAGAGAGRVRLRWPLPASVGDATVAGAGRLVGRDIELTGTSGRVEVTWTRTGDPGPSMERTLQRLQGEYTQLGLPAPR